MRARLYELAATNIQRRDRFGTIGCCASASFILPAVERAMKLRHGRAPGGNSARRDGWRHS
jgi:hypothetical protein